MSLACLSRVPPRSTAVGASDSATGDCVGACLCAVSLLPLAAADTPRELHVTRHDGDPLAMDGAQVRLLHEPHDVRLCRLLDGQQRVRLPAVLLVREVGHHLFDLRKQRG